MANTQSARLAPFFIPNVNLNFLVSFPQELWTCARDTQLPQLCTSSSAHRPCSVAWQNWTDWEPRFEGSLHFWKGQDRGSDGMWVWNWQCLLRTVNEYISAELDRGLVNSRVISGRPSKTREVTADVTDLRAQLVVPFAWPTSKAVMVRSLKHENTDLQQSEESL